LHHACLARGNENPLHQFGDLIFVQGTFGIFDHKMGHGCIAKFA
jgi:hypothetical protein